MPESTLLFDLTDTEPKLIQFVARSPFFMDPKNFIDLGLPQVMTLTGDNDLWTKLSLGRDRSAMISTKSSNSDSAKVYEGIWRSNTLMDVYGLTRLTKCLKQGEELDRSMVNSIL